MAQKTLTSLTAEVQDYIPEIAMAKVGRAANMVLQRIAKEFAEYGRTTFTTRAKTTTGTVAVTLNSTGVTFSSAVLASTDPIMLIKVDGVDDWIVLTYASTTTGTLSSAWPAATNATATYTIVYPTVTFGSDVLHPHKIKQENYEPLKVIGDLNREATSYAPGRPIAWSFTSTNTGATPDDSYRIWLHPAPDDEYLYQVAYKKRPQAYTVSDGSTKSNLPAIWDATLFYGTMFHAFLMDSKAEEASPWKGLYEEAFMEARSTVMSEYLTRMGDLGDDLNYVYESRPVGG